MDRWNLLFLAPHWRVSLLRLFKRSRQTWGIDAQILCADSNAYSPSLKECDRAFQIPLFNQPECLQRVLEICDDGQVGAIIPLTNKSVEFLDTHRDPFQKQGIHLYISGSDAIKICHDKLKLVEFFDRASIAMPPAQLLSSAKPFADFPWIAKPRVGEGSQQVFKIQDNTDLEYYRSKFPAHIAQTFIEGCEYTVDWFSARSGEHLLVVPRERLSVKNGEVWISKIEMNETLIQRVKEAASALQLQGPANLQGILDRDGRFHFTDINLRFGSGSVHSILAGADFPGLIWHELTGQSLTGLKGSVKNGSVLSRFHDGFMMDD